MTPWENTKLAANGKPIVENFNNWFSDSKVRTNEGIPLVVYHGAPDARFEKEDGIFKNLNQQYGREGGDSAFWFSSSIKTAVSYADERRAFDYQNAKAGIIAVYLSLQNPLVINASGQRWREAQALGKTSNVIKKAKENGCDGAIILNVKDDYNNTEKTQATDIYVVFSSAQIKSATENSGLYLRDSNSISDRFEALSLEQSNKAKANIAENNCKLLKFG